MNLVNVVGIYFLLFLVIFLLATKFGKSFLASALLSMIIGLVYLYLIYPPCEVDEQSDNSICVIIYSVIVIVSLLTCVLLTLYLALFGDIFKNYSKLKE